MLYHASLRPLFDQITRLLQVPVQACCYHGPLRLSQGCPQLGAPPRCPPPSPILLLLQVLLLLLLLS